MKRIEGKIAIVTGGSRGIGKAIVQKLINEGAKAVISCDVIEPDYNLENVFFEKLDITDRTSTKNLIEKIEEQFGKIDILVNNAGITKDGLMVRMSEEQFDQVLNVNLKGVFNMTQFVAKSMMKKKSGSIVTISSVVGLHGNPGQTNYAATKAGVIGITKSLAKELGSRGVRANCVAPGFVKTPMTDVLDENMLNDMTKLTALGRLGLPEDIANAVLFLASDESSYITGEVLKVSGGLMM